MATRGLEHEHFALSEMAVRVGDRDGQAQHPPSKHRIGHLGHQGSQGVVVNVCQKRATGICAEQQVFAKRLDNFRHGVGLQAEFMRSLQLFEGVQFGLANMSVGDENEGNEAGGGFGTVAGVGTHGGFVFQVGRKELGGDWEIVARRDDLRTETARLLMTAATPPP